MMDEDAFTDHPPAADVAALRDRCSLAIVGSRMDHFGILMNVSAPEIPMSQLFTLVESHTLHIIFCILLPRWKI